ncbi:hypothetical protein UFOVP399_28 [uncultured Caudovirales phage]|uniref:Uncharacterized protein n=1 Tax=uncultured Caudovirales phage TaxID=2100421 RepID=A0A6J5M2F4_9CAUD|nr:hypothetical protein UFOVP399_28 [uncultured Caudovirales phage]
MIAGPLLRIIAPIVGVVVIFGAGYWTGYGHGQEKGERIAYRAAEVAAKEIVVREVEVEECQAENYATQEAKSKQAAATVELVRTDQELRKQAEARARESDKRAAEREKQIYQSLTELKGLINEGTVKGCFSEPVGDRFAELFNDTIAAGENDSSP